MAALWCGFVAATFALRNHHSVLSRDGDDLSLPTQNCASSGKSTWGKLPDLIAGVWSQRIRQQLHYMAKNLRSMAIAEIRNNLFIPTRGMVKKVYRMSTHPRNQRERIVMWLRAGFHSAEDALDVPDSAP